VVLDLFWGAVGVAVTAALAAAAVYGGALTLPAGIVAAAFGSAIVVLAGFPFLLLLVLFVVTSSVATRYRFAEKRRRHVQEGKAGERGVSNVVAHIVLPVALAAAAGFRAIPPAWAAVAYAGALAFGISDTLASEFGVLAGEARSVLTGKRVESGTNGGVSAVGELFAFAGAAGTAVVGWGFFVAFRAAIVPAVAFLATVTAAGFVGCQIDSVLGETLENRGYLTKGGTNFLGMLAAVGIALALTAGAVGRL
jgi:uncharacterized protein (TIGR00297 family)